MSAVGETARGTITCRFVDDQGGVHEVEVKRTSDGFGDLLGVCRQAVYNHPSFGGADSSLREWEIVIQM